MFYALKNQNSTQTWLNWARVLMLLPVFISFNGIAEQVEVTGTAKIVNGNMDKAREDAINQALNYASLRAGVNFSSQQQISQCSLTQDTFSM